MRIRNVLTVVAATFTLACIESASGPTPVATVTVTSTGTTLNAIGATVQATAAAATSSGAAVPAATFTWTTSNSAAATVDVNGLITAVANGSATITATTGTVSGTVGITVAQTVATVVVTPGTVSTFTSIGATQALGATARDANNNAVAGATFTWTSSSAGVASVNSAGVVTSVGNGSATITATSQFVPGTRSVTVTQAVASVVITPGSALSFDAATATTSLSAVARDGLAVTVGGATIAWSSTATGVATVSGAGLVTSVANGTARIIASASGRADTVNVTVAQVATNIALTCANYSNLTSVGATVQCSAAVRDRLNRPTTGVATWSASNTNIGTVSTNGLVSAVDNGDVTIFAGYAGLSSASQLVRVDLSIALGSTRTGYIRGSGVGQQWDVTGGGTRANYMMWVHRSPFVSGGLNPRIYFSTTAAGVNTSRYSSELPWLAASGSEMYARADMANSTANTDLYVVGGTTTGNYVLAVADCRVPHVALAPGYYSGGGVIATDCAILSDASGSSPFLVPAATGMFTATAGTAVTVEIIGACAACAGTRLPDPVLHVFGPNDGQAWWNDDGSGINLNSRVAFTAPSTGNYTVLVSDISGRTGAYAICIFNGCTAYAAVVATPPTGGLDDATLQGTDAPQRLPSIAPDGWRSSLTVEKAYEFLKAQGVVPPDFDPKRVLPLKPVQ